MIGKKALAKAVGDETAKLNDEVEQVKALLLKEKKQNAALKVCITLWHTSVLFILFRILSCDLCLQFKLARVEMKLMKLGCRVSSSTTCMFVNTCT